MAKKKQGPHDAPADLDCDALVAQLEAVKGSLTAPAGWAPGDGEAAPAVDPAALLAIIDVVLKVLAWIRARR